MLSSRSSSSGSSRWCHTLWKAPSNPLDRERFVFSKGRNFQGARRLRMTNVNRTTNRRQMLFASGVLISGLLPTNRTVAQEDGIQPVFDPLVGKTWVALASDSKTHA